MDSENFFQEKVKTYIHTTERTTLAKSLPFIASAVLYWIRMRAHNQLSATKDSNEFDELKQDKIFVFRAEATN